MKPARQVRALMFDVFGTCVDWRSAIVREGTALAALYGVAGIDWAAIADAWRGLYHPQMEEVRCGRRPWVRLDVLHRESLDMVMRRFGVTAIPAQELDALNKVWHRLDPWPDTVPGLARLKSRFVIAPNSNGHIALMIAMAKRAELPWDAVLGAEMAQQYKPMPEVYFRNVDMLGLTPSEVMMVAAHNYDLIGARACGLRTAFVPRLSEFGPHQTSDLGPAQTYDVIAKDFEDLAAQLGC